MTKAQISDIEDRLNTIDVRLAKGDEKFKWIEKLLYGIYALLIANLVLATIQETPMPYKKKKKTKKKSKKY